MKARCQILHLEDSLPDAELVHATLANEDIDADIRHVTNREEFAQALEETEFDLILSDFGFPTFDGNTALRLAKQKRPDVPFIFVTGSLGEEKAIETFTQGATDYVLKDRLSRLIPALLRALREADERRERQKAMAQIQDQARLLDLAQDAIMVCDLSDRVRFVNQTTETMFGWPRSEILGRKVTVLLQPDVSAYAEAKRSLLELGKWSGEMEEHTQDGRKLIVSNRWSLLRDENAVPKSILITKTDVTEKKKLEAQFLRAQRLESLGTLAGGIAHDLNNVLAPILIAAELLQLRITDPECLDWLRTLETSAIRGSELIKQILAFARGAEGLHGEVQIRRLIDDILKLLKETFPPSIQIEAEIPSDLWIINGDSTQLHQVLMNLCINARDAMVRGGTIRIAAENLLADDSFVLQHPKAKPGPYVVITVADTGIGMPPHILERIFDPFFTTKEIGKGTGLGLSTALSIIKGHSGFLDVYSELGKGTRFSIYLPALTIEGSQRGERQHTVLPRGNHEGILIVDDEPALVAITRATLENHGYRVFTAGDGTEGVAVYAQNQRAIQVVLADMMMPYMDGPAMIRALQKLDPALKIIAFSGLAENEKIAQIAATNRIRFLPKPFTTEKLLQAVQEALSEPVPSGT